MSLTGLTDVPAAAPMCRTLKPGLIQISLNPPNTAAEGDKGIILTTSDKDAFVTMRFDNHLGSAGHTPASTMTSSSTIGSFSSTDTSTMTTSSTSSAAVTVIDKLFCVTPIQKMVVGV